MPDYEACRRCGESGHWARECEADVLVAVAPDKRIRLAAYNQGVPPRVLESEIADASSWAADIREAFGWDQASEEKRLRRIAAEQAVEFRRSQIPA